MGFKTVSLVAEICMFVGGSDFLKVYNWYFGYLDDYTPCCVINTEPEYITKVSLDAQDMCLFNIAYYYEFG